LEAEMVVAVSLDGATPSTTLLLLPPRLAEAEFEEVEGVELLTAGVGAVPAGRQTAGCFSSCKCCFCFKVARMAINVSLFFVSEAVRANLALTALDPFEAAAEFLE